MGGHARHRLAAIFAAALLAGCTNATADMTEGAPRILGRHAETAEGVKRFAWPASGVEARFHGSRVVAVIEDTGSNILDITVDGKTELLHLQPGRQAYTVFERDAPGTHHISLTRRSEIFDDGVTGFVSLETDGRFLDLPEPERRILFLGDSISVGYGAEGPDASCAYSAETGAPLRAWTALTARAFDADWHTIAVSGRGVVRNYGDADIPTMPDNFERTLPEQDGAWDHEQWVPDVVVINLGTNDYWAGDPGDEFTDAYEALLARVRDVHPQAPVYAAFIRPAEPDARTLSAIRRIGTAVARRNAAGDAAVFLVTLPIATEGHVWGCDSHPGLDSHRVMAQAMIARIGQDLGWTAD